MVDRATSSWSRALSLVGLVALLQGCPQQPHEDGDGGAADGGTEGGSTCAAGSCNGGLETNCNEQVCCHDYQGIFSAMAAQNSCAAIHGVYSSIPCRATDLVGSCVLYGDTGAQQTVRYYAGYVDLEHHPGTESGQANCDALHGDFILPNGTGGTCTGGDNRSDGGTGGDGGDAGATTTFSCFGNGGTDLHCYEYKNVSPSQLSTLRGSCMGTPGTGCTIASLAGCCTSSRLVEGATVETCYYTDVDPADAMRACAIVPGTWSPLP